MKLPSNVKVKNAAWNIFPFSKYTAQAIYPNIYFTRDVYENLKSDNPDPRHVAALRHEQTHIMRQKAYGWLKWELKYISSSKFRLSEELEAIKSSMTYLKSVGEEFDTERKARILSSYLYLWCVSYEKAKLELDNSWKNLNGK